MLTRSVFNGIRDPELREAMHLDSRSEDRALSPISDSTATGLGTLGSTAARLGTAAVLGSIGAVLGTTTAGLGIAAILGGIAGLGTGVGSTTTGLGSTGPGTSGLGNSPLNWVKSNVINNFQPDAHSGGQISPKDEQKPLQQSDLLRKFYLSIAEHGLKHTFMQDEFKPEDLPNKLLANIWPNNIPFISSSKLAHSVEAGVLNISKEVDEQSKSVIIVGAGMAGLVAGYELKKAGYDVTILEMSQRFGGRVKTVGEKEGFDKGLHADAGAMRLPLPPDPKRPTCKTIHYLTDYYAIKKFKLEPVSFLNTSSQALYNFYGNATKISDWKDSQFSDYWPGWNDKLEAEGLDGEVKNISEYYKRTTRFVVNLLRRRLSHIPSHDLPAQAEQWNIWTRNWCQFSFESFLRSTVDGIKSQLESDYLTYAESRYLDGLRKYLPWPDPAIIAFTVFNYTLTLDMSLVSYVQEDMAHWWSEHMHSLKGGLSALPTAFVTGKGQMEENIVYNRTVTKVEYFWKNDQEKYVEVSGVFTSSGKEFSIVGRSVILTPPLHVIRGLQIVNGVKPPASPDPKITAKALKPFPKEFQQAIQNVNYTPSTKILLQYKKQFWNTGKDPSSDIIGGFSKTNMPVSQLHYPTQPVSDNQKGILLIYTWKAEAILWGALTKDMAVRLAIDQVDQLHPRKNTKELFEVGYVQAWGNDPTTLGAFAKLRPREYASVLYLMQNSWRNVYFAGEAISFANGWIQGALESGLRAAYQVFSDDQEEIRLLLGDGGPGPATRPPRIPGVGNPRPYYGGPGPAIVPGVNGPPRISKPDPVPRVKDPQPYYGGPGPAVVPGFTDRPKFSAVEHVRKLRSK